MAGKILFIYNPRSGKGMIKNRLSDIIDIFTKGGYDVSVRPTQSKGDLREQVISRSGEYDLLAVSGGDGTVNEAAGAMCGLPEEKRVPIGYIPTGSTNDFGRNFGIPSDTEAAARLIVSGKPRKCDVGTFNGMHFVYVAASGAFTEVSYETPQKIKNMLGYGAYILEGIKRVPSISETALSVTVDGVSYEGKYIVFLVLNSSHVAGVDLKEYYSIDTADGEFEAVLLEKPENIIALEQSLSAVRKGQSEGRGFRVIRGSSFMIKTEKPVKWTLDGEYGGETDTAEIEVLHGAVEFIGGECK